MGRPASRCSREKSASPTVSRMVSSPRRAPRRSLGLSLGQDGPPQYWMMTEGPPTTPPNSARGGPACSSSCCPKRFPPVLDPRDEGRLEYWDFFMCILLFFISILLPYEAAFMDAQEGGFFAFERFVDVVFVMDMSLQFCLQYPDPNNPAIFVKDPWRIAKHYIGTWFFFDLVSVLPLSQIVRWSVAAHATERGIAEDLKLVRIVRLIRLLRLRQVAQMIKRFQTTFGLSYGLLSLTEFVCGVSICCHWMACLWGGIALQSRSDRRTWLDKLEADKGGDEGLYTEPWSIYVISLYWSIMTLTSIGYGDVVPQTESEYIIASVCMVIMASTWTYVIGQVCGVVATLMPHDVAFKRTMDDLNWFMEDRRISQEFRMELRRYFHECRNLRRLHDHKVIIEQMSPMLQGEVSKQMLGPWLNKVDFLHRMDMEVVVRVARQLRPVLFAPKEAVCSERSLYIVRRGVCMRNLKLLGNGDVWGEDMIISNPHLRSQIRVKCLTYLEALSLRCLDLFDALHAFPEEALKLRWSQIKLATIRGVCKIARTVRELQTRNGLDVWSLSEWQRFVLLKDVLEGRFAGEVPREPIITSRGKTRSPAPQRDSNIGPTRSLQPRFRSSGTSDSFPDSAASHNMMAVPIEDLADIKASLSKLTNVVATLKGAMNEMAARSSMR